MSVRRALRLRPARIEDLALLRRWRNAPSSRRWFVSTKPVGAAEHRRWLTTLLADRKKVLWIVESASRPAGQVRLDLLGRGAAEISVTIAPALRGHGLGAAALAAAARAAKARGLRRLDAVVLEGNEASVFAFLRAGFFFHERIKIGGRAAYRMTRSL